MRTLIVVFGAVLVAFALSLFVPAAPEQPVVIETSAVVLRGTEILQYFRPQVSADEPDEYTEEHTLCSGVVVDRNPRTNEVVILTARHCFTPSPITFLGFAVGETIPLPKVVQFKDGDEGAIRSVVLFTNSDMAEIVASPLREHTVAPLATNIPFRGTPLVVFGDNGNYPWVWSDATDATGADTYLLPVGTTRFQYSLLSCASCNHGDSGAGIFEYAGTAHPRLVGILANGNDHGLIGFTTITKQLLFEYPAKIVGTLDDVEKLAQKEFNDDQSHASLPHGGSL